jgi:hypothetical protein
MPEAQRQFLVYHHNRGAVVYVPGHIRFPRPVPANFAKPPPFVNRPGAMSGGRTKATYCKNAECVETWRAFRVNIVLFGVQIGDIEIPDRTCTDSHRVLKPEKCGIIPN